MLKQEEDKPAPGHLDGVARSEEAAVIRRNRDSASFAGDRVMR